MFHPQIHFTEFQLFIFKKKKRYARLDPNK